MAEWHHWLDGHESEWTLGVGDGQGGLACCDSWGRKESDTTERLNWIAQVKKELYECQRVNPGLNKPYSNEDIFFFRCSVMSDSLNRGMPGLPVHHQLKAFIQTHIHQVVMPSNHLIVCRPLLLLPSVFPSIRVFPNDSVLHTRWLKYWSFSLSINPSNEYPDWFPLGLTGLISLQSKGLSGDFSNTTV